MALLALAQHPICNYLRSLLPLRHLYNTITNSMLLIFIGFTIYWHLTRIELFNVRQTDTTQHMCNVLSLSPAEFCAKWQPRFLLFVSRYGVLCLVTQLRQRRLIGLGFEFKKRNDIRVLISQ